MIFRNKLLTTALISVIAVTLVGCTATPEKTVASKPTASSTTKTMGGETALCKDPGPWGDVIAKKVIIDDFGEYCATTIDPKSDTATYESKKVDAPTLVGTEFTTSDTRKAYDVAVKTFVETTLDSTRLDNYDQSEQEWFNDNKKVIADTDVALFENFIKANSLLESGFTITSVLPEPIVRDGSPRAKETNITLNKIYVEKYDNLDEPLLNVRFDFTATYDVTNKQIVDIIVKNDDKINEDTLKVSNPELFSSEGKGLILKGKYVYLFKSGNVEQINSVGTQWSLTTADGSYTLAEK